MKSSVIEGQGPVGAAVGLHFPTVEDGVFLNEVRVGQVKGEEVWKAPGRGKRDCMRIQRGRRMAGKKCKWPECV